MKRLYIFLFILVFSFITTSCELDDDGDNFHYTALKITDAELPDSFDFGQIYDVKVTMLRPDTCTLMEGFDVNRDNETTTYNIRNVTAIGIVLDRNDCEEANQEVTNSFRFEVLYNEPYLFRFYTGEDDNGEKQYIEVEVPVN